MNTKPSKIVKGRSPRNPSASLEPNRRVTRTAPRAAASTMVEGSDNNEFAHLESWDGIDPEEAVATGPEKCSESPLRRHIETRSSHPSTPKATSTRGAKPRDGRISKRASTVRTACIHRNIPVELRPVFAMERKLDRLKLAVEEEVILIKRELTEFKNQKAGITHPMKVPRSGFISFVGNIERGGEEGNDNYGKQRPMRYIGCRMRPVAGSEQKR